jgi:8-oxo-dGTP diphosphatase
VLSAAHLDVVPIERIASAKAHLVPVREVGVLPYDHNEIIDIAVDRLRDEYDRIADPRGLLGGSFTLRDLQLLHVAVTGGPFRGETFRKRMEPQAAPTGETLRGVAGKPPRLFRQRSCGY